MPKVHFNTFKTQIHIYEQVSLENDIVWMQYAVDRARFQKRINKISKILEPVLLEKLAKGNGQNLLCS
jgi:hypothetical protein